MQYHRPPLIGSNFQPNLRPLPLPNPIHHHRETPMATNKPSSSNLEDLNIYGQSTMIEGGLLEFCRPPPKQLQFKPVRPLSSQLQPFWGANGSIVFVDARAKLFYTPAQVRELYRDRPHSPMRTTFRPPNQPPPRQPPRPPCPHAGFAHLQSLLGQLRSVGPSISTYRMPTQAYWPPPSRHFPPT